jgi:hypothetical protein
MTDLFSDPVQVPEKTSKRVNPLLPSIVAELQYKPASFNATKSSSSSLSNASEQPQVKTPSEMSVSFAGKLMLHYDIKVYQSKISLFQVLQSPNMNVFPWQVWMTCQLRHQCL